jgi:hypothetical protein
MTHRIRDGVFVLKTHIEIAHREYLFRGQRR